MDDVLSPLGFSLANKDGICDFDAFVERQAYSRNHGEGCFQEMLRLKDEVNGFEASVWMYTNLR